MRKSTCPFVTTFALLLAAGDASAQEPPPWFDPAPADAPLPPNITPNPDGSVTVTRTPEEGVEAHATTSSGTVHAYGCNRVDVDPNARSQSPPGPCPLAHFPPPPPPPPVYMPPPPPRFMYPPVKNPTQAMRPRWAPDPSRRNALIASSIVFGLGTMLSGTAYTVSVMTSAPCSDRLTTWCNEPSKPALYAMGTILTLTPSIPRFVVGDYGKAILYTALRGGSFAAGAFVDWNDPTYLVPITFSLIAPLTLGIIDLATTPHREQLEGRTATNSFQLLGVGPTVATDFRGRSIPALGAVGTF